MIVAIHQPEHLPYAGFFHKMMNCDTFVILDQVKFSRGGFQNRNRIYSSTGPKWLTVPLSGHTQVPIRDVRIASGKEWPKVHRENINSAYRNAPHFGDLLDFLETIYSKNQFDLLYKLNLKIITSLQKLLGIKTPVILASGLNVSGKKTDLLVEICQKLQADEYLSGIGGKNYLEESKFSLAEIKTKFQKFNHPVYKQPGSTFIPNLSIIDIIANLGSRETFNQLSKI